MGELSEVLWGASLEGGDMMEGLRWRLGGTLGLPL